MAKPRVFISSTFYDLRHIRDDLERFVRDLGYEAVRHEVGAIPYSKMVPLEESAYREVAFCDIIVCIIGGRYGTDSVTRDGSITQNELEQALKNGVQVYIFVDQNVLSEFSTYQLNKANKKMKYCFVDDIKIFQYLEKVYSLPQNNPITGFLTSASICTFLQAQWAGLFQRYLQEEKRLSELEVLDEMKTVSGTLQQLVKFLTEERKNKDEAIKNILLANHPAFRRFAEITRTKYRVFFSNKAELDEWLDARSYKKLGRRKKNGRGSYAEWINRKTGKSIALMKDIFDDDGKLKPYTEEDWDKAWIEIHSLATDDDDNNASS